MRRVALSMRKKVLYCHRCRQKRRPAAASTQMLLSELDIAARSALRFVARADRERAVRVLLPVQFWDLQAHLRGVFAPAGPCCGPAGAPRECCRHRCRRKRRPAATSARMLLSELDTAARSAPRLVARVERERESAAPRGLLPEWKGSENQQRSRGLVTRVERERESAALPRACCQSG